MSPQSPSPPPSGDPSPESGSLSRRAVLRRAGGALPLGAAARDPNTGPLTFGIPQDLRVMTWNLGLGTNLARLIDGDRRTVDSTNVHERFAEVRDSAPATRMAVVAGRIADALPAVVGLQEAALVRRGPSDYTGGSEPNADTVVVDFLDELTTALERATDVGYRVAVVSENADEEFPAEAPDGERFDVRLTDRDAVLVREDVAVARTEAANFALNVAVTLRDGTRVTATRGYCIIEGAIDGAPFTLVNAHLAVSSGAVRRAQAGQLLGRLDGLSGPVVVLGDFNSSPADDSPSAYDALTDRYTDVWPTVRDDDGPTCCQWSNLRNDRSRLRSRIDLVLTDGPVEARGARRVGADPESRISVPRIGDGSGTETITVWPSDHAGVVVDLHIEPQVGDLFTVLRSLLTP